MPFWKRDLNFSSMAVNLNISILIECDIRSFYGICSGAAGVDLVVNLLELAQLPTLVLLSPVEFGHSPRGCVLHQVVIFCLSSNRGTMWQLSLRLGAEETWLWLA